MRTLFTTLFCALALMVLGCTKIVEAPLDASFTPDKEYTLSTDIDVSGSQALNLANRFRGINKLTKSSSSSDICEEDVDIKEITSNGKTLFYVLNYPDGGFVLVSATKEYYPVLAYASEGNFDYGSISGGMSIWMGNLEEAIVQSPNQTDSIKRNFRRIWNYYEGSQNHIPNTATKTTPTAAEIACWERCDELFMQYGGEGWNFAPLSNVQSIFEDAGYSAFYNQLCYSANYNHSSLNCSVVGWKEGENEKQVGPLLSTVWHQDSPFDSLCGDYSPGCGPIAMAQVMKYYEYPPSFVYNGETITWDSIPNEVKASSNQAKLVMYVGEKLNTHYWSSGSWTTPGDMEDGIEEIGYNVVRDTDNVATDVMQSIIVGHRPVIMLGMGVDHEFLPGDTQYIGRNSHYWVCDGGREVGTAGMYAFAEWQPYDCGSFTASYYSIDNPYVLDGGPTTFYCHMNWGYEYPDNTWYLYDNIDYRYSRQNYLISRNY